MHEKSSLCKRKWLIYNWIIRIRLLKWNVCNILTFDPAVNQEKGVHPVEDISVSPWRVEFGAIAAPTWSRWVSNNNKTRVPQAVWVSWRQLVGVRFAVRGRFLKRFLRGPGHPDLCIPSLPNTTERINKSAITTQLSTQEGEGRRTLSNNLFLTTAPL